MVVSSADDSARLLSRHIFPSSAVLLLPLSLPPSFLLFQTVLCLSYSSLFSAKIICTTHAITTTSSSCLPFVVIWKFGCALAGGAVPAPLSIHVDCILSYTERLLGKATKSSGCWNLANFLSDTPVDSTSSTSAACSRYFFFST
ncbi:unnamed protein product [Taenia asiatica]|uniref:Secreted protein n=1 Tax=Taenia asiatica TaxID=60517 RepID=A0A0R3WGK9_TAEAS|nr:unnamed protein product [Taenia asiatica]